MNISNISGDDNNLFGFSGTDTFKIATAGTDRLTINSSGAVTSIANDMNLNGSLFLPTQNELINFAVPGQSTGIRWGAGGWNHDF